MTSVAPILQGFFTERLTNQRQASPNTILAYRDTFKLLLRYAAAATGKNPAELDLADLGADQISAFLRHLETERGNTPRTRNARLTAIRSFFSYAALNCPEHSHTIQRVLAIPQTRLQKNLVTYLDDNETTAFLSACDQTSRAGRRDHAMFTLAIQTGLRVSELIGLDRSDLHLGVAPNVHCVGKGRKERNTPLTPETVNTLTAWLKTEPGRPDAPLFATSTGRRLSRDAVERRVSVTAAKAGEQCLSIANKQVTAHTMRHAAAMRLLKAGVDITIIALWLGHERVSTTNIYLHADMAQKEQAIAKANPLEPGAATTRYRPSDTLIAFLESL
ncbi:MAG: site-specific integrase [Bifidobacteriaceae bacterium]|jgi:site-specific recombinase XerD|nr:site-specific integrase [Bifidobacteriaceae bacterium]